MCIHVCPCACVSVFVCVTHHHRYLSHFRSVHRGAYFAQMRTTTVRKLLPESWGFFCPVHTPDGSPCGLLNHFAAHTRVVTSDADNPHKQRNAILQVCIVPSPPRATSCFLCDWERACAGASCTCTLKCCCASCYAGAVLQVLLCGSSAL